MSSLLNLQSYGSDNSSDEDNSTSEEFVQHLKPIESDKTIAQTLKFDVAPAVTSLVSKLNKTTKNNLYNN